MAARWTESEIGLLIPDENVGSQLPSTRAIFRVIHPRLQRACMGLAKRYHKDPSGDQAFVLPQPFGDYRITRTLYQNWGEEDRSSDIIDREDGTGIGLIMYLSHYGGIPVMSIGGALGKMIEPSTKFTPVGRAIIVSGGLNEAGFTEFLRCMPFNPKKAFPGIGNFYYDRLNLAAQLGAFGSGAPRLRDSDVSSIVGASNRLPSSEMLKHLVKLPGSTP